MQTSPYPGDKAASEVLRRADCRYTIGELKALMAGVLSGPTFVQPSEVLDHIEFGAIDQPHFGDKELARDFLGVFFGLWNQIADHRNPDKPFSFSQPDPTWKAEDFDAWLKFAQLREAEIGEFLVGLGMSDVPVLADLDDSSELGTTNYLPHLVSKHLGHLERETRMLQKSKSRDAKSICKIIQALDDDTKKHHRLFMEEMLSLQPVSPAKPKSAMREGPKIGRNDPCHCGSGKKFKQCCLQ